MKSASTASQILQQSLIISKMVCHFTDTVIKWGQLVSNVVNFGWKMADNSIIIVHN